MPIYEYQCQACGKELEVIQKHTDAPLQDCPECGKASLKKKVTAAAFRLKGGGWYETDFKSGKKKNIAKADSKRKADKKASSASKTKSKSSSGSGKKTG